MSVASSDIPNLLEEIDAIERPRLRPLLRRLEKPEYYRKWMEIVLPHLNYFMHDKGWAFTLYRSNGAREYTTSEYAREGHLILQFDDGYTFQRITAPNARRIPKRIEIDENNNVTGLGNGALIWPTYPDLKYLFQVIAFEFTHAHSDQVLYWIDFWIENKRPDLRKLLDEIDTEFARGN